MPFLEDTDRDPEVLHKPVWGAFALLRDQLERLVAINIGWALQLLPGMVALATPAWPAWLRALLALYTLITLAPATGTLYALAAHACRRDDLHLALVRETLRAVALPSVRTLVPLYSMFGLLGWAATLAASARLVALDVPVRLLILLGLVCATYWGPLLAEDPERSALAIVRESVLLAWRYPAQTLWTCAAVVLALLIGTISIGGLVLVVPVLVALLQTRRYQERTARQYYARRRGKVQYG